MSEPTNELGPLASLLGTWEGDKGHDTAPSADRKSEITLFRERVTFEPTGRVDNHEQTLFGLRYTKRAWRIGEADQFHEEIGYWLWDASAKQVICCFMIPRGVTVVAGGTVEPSARTFELRAEVGSNTYGICSNKFLDEQFKTVAVTLKVTVESPSTFSYEENTELKIKGQAAVFNHRDKNTLRRIS